MASFLIGKRSFMKKILILGATGLLGSRMLENFENATGTYLSSTTRSGEALYYLDGGDEKLLNEIVNKVRPDVILNCIGLANLDECEKFPEKCWLINTKIPVLVSRLCQERQIKFIQISTDNFSNDEKQPLRENDRMNFVNQYGFAKYYSERLVLKINPNSLILRVNFFHFNSVEPKTFIDNLIKKIKNKEFEYSFTDVIFTPVSTQTLISYLKILIELDSSGIINVASSEAISKYEFHDLVLGALNLDTYYHKMSQIDKVKLNAQRPKQMSLNNSKLLHLTNVAMPSISDMITHEINYCLNRS